MTTHNESGDTHWMAKAMALAGRGKGFVEPNPMVGCVIVATHETGDEVIGEGWHRAFGQAHAEVEAIRDARSKGKSTVGATAYVTLEPCRHYGKTPPCTLALLEADIKRVVVAMCDPFEAVDGGGITQLRDKGVEVTLGCLETEARELNAPYLTRIEKQRPWIIAKWAMTLDGKISSRAGSSRWISSEASRQIVHLLRTKSDAIMIGSRTALSDDPLLTVRVDFHISQETATGNGASATSVTTQRSDRIEMSRRSPVTPFVSLTAFPAAVSVKDMQLLPHRTPLRVVFDSNVTLPPSSRLVQTAREVGVLVAASRHVIDTNETSRENAAMLADCGCEVLPLEGARHHERMIELLRHLAERGVTNLLVEGGGALLGLLFDHQLIDEVYAFIAPKLIGGSVVVSPIGGLGLEQMSDAILLKNPVVEAIGTDIYCHGRIAR